MSHFNLHSMQMDNLDGLSSEQGAAGLLLGSGHEVLKGREVQGIYSRKAFREESGRGLAGDVLDFLHALRCKSLEHSGLNSLCIKTLVSLGDCADSLGLGLSNGTDGLGLGRGDFLHPFYFGYDLSLFFLQKSIPLTYRNDARLPSDSVGVLEACLHLKSCHCLLIHRSLVRTLVVHSESNAQQSTAHRRSEFCKLSCRDGLEVIGEGGTVVVGYFRRILQVVPRESSYGVLQFQSDKLLESVDQVDVLRLSSEDARLVQLDPNVHIDIDRRGVLGVDANGVEVLSVFLHVGVAEELYALLVDDVLSGRLLTDGVARPEETDVACRNLHKCRTSVQLACDHPSALEGVGAITSHGAHHVGQEHAWLLHHVSTRP
mmetsp:Transcript_10478/g.20095  ORF Transcript_10478/g.20095 Transcript_10478/m.20095 type:complete len:374 (-) Transcript_10478:566-1687(-)